MNWCVHTNIAFILLGTIFACYVHSVNRDLIISSQSEFHPFLASVLAFLANVGIMSFCIYEPCDVRYDSQGRPMRSYLCRAMSCGVPYS
ncbi:hypothetical protein L596_002058 [Steinernema carpocapsae]|uniref:Uncharacterized protein n=1 Tax=Steinernema carpocapsae TaxID=34508 RepID=A0A4U8UN28_STECR|nr:hypothetical protein L596_002058 [Steinernema carpocapsae]